MKAETKFSCFCSAIRRGALIHPDTQLCLGLSQAGEALPAPLIPLGLSSFPAGVPGSRGSWVLLFPRLERAVLLCPASARPVLPSHPPKPSDVVPSASPTDLQDWELLPAEIHLRTLENPGCHSLSRTILQCSCPVELEAFGASLCGVNPRNIHLCPCKP